MTTPPAEVGPVVRRDGLEVRQAALICETDTGGSIPFRRTGRGLHARGQDSHAGDSNQPERPCLRPTRPTRPTYPTCPPVRSRSDRPSQLGRRRARIGTHFIPGRTNHIVRDRRVGAIEPARLERLLHAPVFSGMKRQDRHAASRRQAERQLPQERVERREFVVHRNAQRLERAADRRFDLTLPRAAARPA